ncbi:MAG: chromate efflux transporter [Cryobacterium sp.]|nr:chromate efflux transporter [Cryobacterium sp.]
MAAPKAVGEVLVVFLRLGLTSFGGPVAHLGYFRGEFVEKRRWLSERAYADLVALCQFLPGPASSQVGMAIGLQRAGYIGMVAAWLAFTMPSAIALVAFALGMTALGDSVGTGWIAGVKAAAVAVVAHAVLSMAKTLTPDAKRATIAIAAMAVLVLVPNALVQVVVIAAAGLVGFVWLRPGDRDDAAPGVGGIQVSRRIAMASLSLFALLLVALPALAVLTENGVLALVDTFYRAGALVFGGGHVVLPLLHAELVPTGAVTNDAFLAGYGAAQAVPGPLFTFAAYLGAVSTGQPSGILGAALALVVIFVPSALLLLGVLPFWERVRHARAARSAVMGLNAGVVGLLAAALYDPVFTQGVTGALSLALATLAFVALATVRVPAWAVVIASALAGALLL